MYHLGGNAFLGGLLAYLPVMELLIGFNLSYVRIERVEGGKEQTGRRDSDRMGDLRCFPEPSLCLSISISNSISPYISFLSNFFLLWDLLPY